jgi:hypothetical protein
MNILVNSGRCRRERVGEWWRILSKCVVCTYEKFIVKLIFKICKKSFKRGD